MDQPFVLRYRPTFALCEAAQATFQHITTGTAPWESPLVVLAVCLYFSLSEHPPISQMTIAQLVQAALLLASVVYLFVIPTIRRWQCRQAYARQVVDEDEVTLTFASDIITIVTAEDTIAHAWGDLQRVYESRKFFYFVTNIENRQFSFFYLPKQALPDEETLLDFIDFVRDRVPSYREVDEWNPRFTLNPEA